MTVAQRKTTQITKLNEFVKKYGYGLGREDFGLDSRKKTKSYREYGAGFFGAKSTQSRRHRGA